MMSNNGHLPAASSQATAGRPGLTDRYMRMGCPVPASAFRGFIPDPEPQVRSATGRPDEDDCDSVFLQLTPAQHLYGRRFGYANIKPGAAAAGIADQKAFIRSAILAAAPELQFEVLECSPMTAHVCLRFGSPEEREAAVARQPYPHDGFSVEVVREGEQGGVVRVKLQQQKLAHVVFLDYPIEERTEEGIRANCSRVGHVVEIDPGCFPAPDLAPVHLVVQREDPESIPAGLRLRYFDRSRTVYPVQVAQCIIRIQIVRVWEAKGSYTSLFQPAAA
jgi:hypothetical protein